MKITTSRYEAELIDQIVDYVSDMDLHFMPDYPRSTMTMDLHVVHSYMPLRLHEMIGARQLDVLHDIYGIKRHLNRRTGKLEDCFVPRFALPDTSKARYEEA